MTSLNNILLRFPYGDILLWVLIAGYAMLTVALIVAVLSENRNPLKALGWVTVLLLFPVGGALLYFVFGRSMRNVRMISRRNRRKLLSRESRPPLPKLGKDLSPEDKQRILLGYAVADATLYPDNTVEVFNDGKSMFDSLLRDISRAHSFINLQFYIIAGDTLGRRLADALIERAHAGVRIRVIYDYIGSFGSHSRKLFTRLKAEGVEVHSFFRIQFPEKLSRLNWRNHRKAVIIDGLTAYIGGMNVADRYLDGGAGFASWRDMAVRVTGPAVTGIQHTFAIDWKFMGHDLLTDDIPPTGDATPLAESPSPASLSERISGVRAQIVSSGPTDRWGNTHMLFLKAISSARRRIFIQTPYFLPSEALLASLQCASLSGVDVRVMMPRRSDSALLTHASASFIEESLLAGIKIYLYEAGMLHAKMLLVDDEFATVGSTNFDYRSFEHNFEENILMYSRQVNAYIGNLFLADQTKCSQVRLSEWNRRPTPFKIRQSLCRLLSPIL